MAPLELQAALGELLGDARLVVSELPECPLKLWLIDADNMDRAFSPEAVSYTHLRAHET